MKTIDKKPAGVEIRLCSSAYRDRTASIRMFPGMPDAAFPHLFFS
jgi:hypothetical protein